MPYASGTKIGPYEIASLLGVGGMGEVYRSRDSKLGREVALKVLPAAVAADPDRLARFSREAKVLAALNHPNIAAIYGLEDSASSHALVMELVEGPTLADRIQAGPIPAEEALPLAKQICEALEYAHERGIIHRDLKPANVKVTPEGTVKVLDFGLAKALDVDMSHSTSNVSNSPTLTVAATQAGMILGTVAYMSPEQAKGKNVDRRTDVWAFGCVLYEMLTGRKPFEGETVTDVLASVVKSEPDWNALPESSAPRIRTLIRRCLVKDPKQRLRDIGEARIAIEETISDVGSIPELPSHWDGETRHSERALPRNRVLPWVLVGVLAVSLITVLAIVKLTSHLPQNSAVLSYIPPPPSATFRDFGFGAGPVVVSPDGKRLAFSATDENGVTKLWIRPLGSSESSPIVGTEDAAAPF